MNTLSLKSNTPDNQRKIVSQIQPFQSYFFLLVFFFCKLNFQPFSLVMHGLISNLFPFGTR